MTSKLGQFSLFVKNAVWTWHPTEWWTSLSLWSRFLPLLEPSCESPWIHSNVMKWISLMTKCTNIFPRTLLILTWEISILYIYCHPIYCAFTSKNSHFINNTCSYAKSIAVTSIYAYQMWDKWLRKNIPVWFYIPILSKMSMTSHMLKILLVIDQLLSLIIMNRWSFCYIENIHQMNFWKMQFI